MAELAASGQSVAQFASAKGLTESSVYHWKNRLAGAVESQRSVLTKRESTQKRVFSEVVVVPRGASSARIEVVTRNGRSVRVEGVIDAAMLREVLRVVESC